jgi:hypothetical protein
MNLFIIDGPGMGFGRRDTAGAGCAWSPGATVKGPQVATVNSCNPKLKEATGINYGPYFVPANPSRDEAPPHRRGHRQTGGGVEATAVEGPRRVAGLRRGP